MSVADVPAAGQTMPNIEPRKIRTIVVPIEQPDTAKTVTTKPAPDSPPPAARESAPKSERHKIRTVRVPSNQPEAAIVGDCDQRGDCAGSAEFRKERFALRGQQQVVTVKAEINGVQGTFILDTGASYLTVRRSFAERAKIPAGASETTLMTANGQAKAKLSKADKVALGKLEAKCVPVAIQDGDGKSYAAGIDGLLGMTFLSRFEIQFAEGFVELRTRNQKR